MAKNIPSITTLSPEDQALMNSQLTKLKKLQDEIAAKNSEEKTLRLEMAKKWFPNPVEGSTNKFDIGFGKLLELTHRITRKLDEAALDVAVMEHKISPDLISQVIKYKAEVSTSGYKALSADDAKLFADIVTVEDGMPGLKIITPKR